MELFCVFLGWLLGLFSQPIISFCEKHYKKENYKKVLFSELKNLAVRLIGTCYQIQRHLGIGGRDNLIWMKNEYEKYPEDCPKNLIASINKILEAPKEQIEELVKAFKAPENVSLHLKTYKLFFVESIFDNLYLFDKKLQQRILALHAQINILNEDLGNANDYHWLTFEGDYKEPNSSIIRANINSCYFEIQRRCKIIVSKIGEAIF